MEDASSWDGSLSSHDFSVSAHAFVEKWRRICPDLPPWSWIPCPISPWFASHAEEGYLSLEKMCLFKSNEEDHDGESYTGKEESCFSEEQESIDDAGMLVQCHSQEVYYYDFHIVYSSSYRVPVLYFRKQRNDGQPLDLEDIEKDLPTHSAKVLLKSKWTFITQEEHPYLKRPWYKLHPCGTSEWMKLLYRADASLVNKHEAALPEVYLMSWLSVVGQVVGLKLSLEMLHDHSEQL